MVNTIDGYYLTLSNNLVGAIAVLKDTEAHKRTFYLYNQAKGEVQEKLFEIVAVKIKDFEKTDYQPQNLTEIYRTEDTVFAVEVSEKSISSGITVDTVKEMFSMIGE